MEERIIIRSKGNSASKVALALLALYVVFFLISGALYKHPFSYGDIFEHDWYIYVVVLVVLVVFYFYFTKMELVVTNRRIYGKAGFGKQVDLPVDSISSVGLGIVNNIIIATSSGKIRFWFINNRSEIHKVVTDLLIERQQKKQVTADRPVIKQEAQSNADELKKYKELLDSGIISQEEFDAKKKQLLGL